LRTPLAALPAADLFASLLASTSCFAACSMTGSGFSRPGHPVNRYTGRAGRLRAGTDWDVHHDFAQVEIPALAVLTAGSALSDSTSRLRGAGQSRPLLRCDETLSRVDEAVRLREQNAASSRRMWVGCG
jgi:hypothetical protein